jgi:hypothetical protein
MNKIFKISFCALFIFLVGCTNEHRLPFVGNQLSGYLFTEKECSTKPCRLVYSGDFIFNVNEQSQKVVYKLEINMGGNVKRLHIGELKNCKVFSVTEFHCDKLSNSAGNLRFPIKYESLLLEKPVDFEKIDAMSDSYAAYLSSFAGFLSSNNKQIVENYDTLIYLLLSVIFFASIS